MPIKRVPVHLNHDIYVKGGQITVTNQTISGGNSQPTKRLQPGDKVTFTSNDDATVIYYEKYSGPPPANTQKESPFGNQLPAGTKYKVADGVKKGKVFTIKKACSFDRRFNFACGEMIRGKFSGGTRRSVGTGGAATPGPND